LEGNKKNLRKLWVVDFMVKRIVNPSEGRHSMIRMVKNYIKTKPRLYDLLNSFRPIKSDVERWLDNFSKVNNKKINFIQIGASDGLRWDPIRRFVIRDGWSGILVEPLPHVFNMLKNNYAYIKSQRLIFVNAAVSWKDDEWVHIWSYSDEFCNSLSLEDRLFYLRRSSFDKKHVEASLKNFDDIEDKIRSFRVQCISVNSLIQKYWDSNRIDLIFIDAEGHDDEIIRAIDFGTTHPKAVLFESHNLGGRKQETYNFLSGKGYKVSDLGGDSVAVRSA
jgi:FkbM family methyltransferase